MTLEFLDEWSTENLEEINPSVILEVCGNRLADAGCFVCTGQAR